MGQVKVQWLGQAAFKITPPIGKVIAIDPWITSDPRTPPALRSVEAAGPKVDRVLVRHAHFDPMADAPAIAKACNAPFRGTAGVA